MTLMLIAFIFAACGMRTKNDFIVGVSAMVLFFSAWQLLIMFGFVS
jgi:hypothetical protein